MIHHAHRCLLIPDVHQDIAWVERIFAQEKAYDLVVFTGDYFDTRMPLQMRIGVEETSVFLDDTRQKLGSRAVFLLGNHDIQYLEAKPACDRHQTPRCLHYGCGSAFSGAAAKKVAKHLSAEFWQQARLFVLVNGWLISHAGVALSLWPERPTLEESLVALEAEAQTALHTMRRGPHPLLQAGVARGGIAPVGGLTWQDWDDEFADALPCPQIVGHTVSYDGARQKNRSWCLDGGQTCYGVLTDGQLEVKVC